MKLLILLICLPVAVFAQQPVKPVISSVNYDGTDIASLSKNIADLSTQIKHIAGNIAAARAQLQLLRDQVAKMNADLSARKKTRSGLDNGTTAANQLDKEIKDLEVKINELNKKITAQQEFIESQHAEITKLRSAIDKLQGKINEAQARDSKSESNKTKKEAAASYTKLKILLDSLPAAQKAKLTAAENKTLSFYQDLYEKDMVFKTASLSARLDAQKDELQSIAEDKKDKIQASEDAMRAIMEMIRQYLERLAAMQSQMSGIR